MEIIEKNHINTTTQLSINSNTTGVANIISRDVTFQWVSDSFANDLTTSSLTVTFDATTSVSRIILDGINFKKFNIYYDGVTANAFSLTTTASTTTTQWTTNSDTAMYLVCTTAACASVTIDMYSTQVANSEKALGWLALSDSKLEFERIPSSKNYKPNIKSDEVKHKMSDGTTRISVKSRRFETSVKYKHVSSTFRDNIKSIYDGQDEFIFVAFGTSTGWDKVAYPAIMYGDFDFYEYSDDAVNAGFGGTIRMVETSS